MQADSGYLEDYMIRLFHHVAPTLVDKNIILDRTHRLQSSDGDPLLTNRQDTMRQSPTCSDDRPPRCPDTMHLDPYTTVCCGLLPGEEAQLF
ncbi:hypothetical protein NDU88_004221 [Pleurodeles waltl]|uniref:Uncharacterized protein n=1 Tax=Pleurodeles waltl TaxID=8319 RepID=A0AAV7T8P8_PLEWA|nr:hypothetical protein NDU88_004221 [Pleurodeles waltl]